MLPIFYPSFRYRFLAFLFCWITLFSFTFSLQVAAKAVLYDGRDGLNSNDISAIAKDQRGLMWIGTANGLNIFDGYNFTKLQGILTNRDITTLKINPDKNEMLVGTRTGLFCVNLTTLTTSKILVDRSKANNSISKIDKICYNNYGKEFFYTVRDVVFRVNNDYSSTRICRISNDTGTITSIKPYDKDHMLVNNGNIYLLNVRNGSVDRFDNFSKIGFVNRLYRSGNNMVIVDAFSQIYITDMAAFKNTKDAPPLNPAIKLHFKLTKSFLKGDKFYCLGENYSFIIYDIKTNKVDTISQKYPDAFEGKIFYSLFVDENNIVWIGTNKGMIKVEDRAISFTKVLYNLPVRISSRKIYQDENDDIFVCSYAGLMHLSKHTGQWIKYNTNNPEAAASNPKAFNGAVFPLCLLPRTPETFYIGYDNQNLLTFNKVHHIFESTDFKYSNANNEKINDILDMAEDGNGKLWMAGNNGIAIYDPKTGSVERHINDRFGIGNNQVRIIYKDTVSRNIIVGATNGVFIFDINKGLLKHFSTASSPALNNNDVLFVRRDGNGDIWLGTNGGGINILSADMKRIRYIRKQDGLSSEIVYSILPENENVKWISTFNGLDRYQVDKRSFTNFFEEDGISSNEFNQNSFLKMRDGRFYFGSINGVTTFYPQQFIQPTPFKIYFAGISKWDNKAQSLHLYYQDMQPGSTITKSPSDLLIELHFGCTDYSDPQRNSYSYRIKEISSNWISLEDRHSLNIGGLPYGKFTLEIKAINLRGATSTNILTYNLNIAQPFYKSWWFFGLILIFIIIIFYGAYLIKSHNFKNVLHLRMKIASNLHDEVGSLLTRITMFSDNLRYSKNNEEQRNIKLEKIAILSRNAVASMSDVLWAIDSRNDFAGNLLDRMREQAEEMLFPLGIDVNFVLQVNDLKKHIDSDTRGEVYLIFKEAINNIVKHSNATEVEITYKLSDKHFYLKIANNGIVESISDISTGQGLHNMKMRAKKIKASIKIERKEAIFWVELEN